MRMIYSERFRHTIDRFIELYGDRTEDIGSSIHGGLAWIQGAKVILLAGGGDPILQPSTSRRLSRLLSLAQHFRRPVLLWDLPFQISNALLINSAIQKNRLQLLKLPVPVISVFEKYAPPSLESQLAIVDGAVVVERDQPDGGNLSISMGENLPSVVKIKDCDHDIRSEILKFLNQASAIPIEDLVHRRINRVRKIVEQRD